MINRAVTVCLRSFGVHWVFIRGSISLRMSSAEDTFAKTHSRTEKNKLLNRKPTTSRK